MRIPCIVFLVIGFLSACRPVSAVETQTAIPSPIVDETLQILPTPEHRPTQDEAQPDSIEEKKPTGTALPTSEVQYRLCSPLADHQIQELPDIVSDPYAPPPMGKDDRHQGVDFAYYNHAGRASIAGEGVQAILPGQVVAVIENRLPYGNMVMIETPAEFLWPELIQGLELTPDQSLYHLYAHFEEPPLVSLEEEVQCGQLLGTVGKTGYNLVMPHLHLETRVGLAGVRFENMAYYDTRALPEEMGNYERWRMSGEFQHFDPIRLFDAFGLGLEDE